jgi:uncharacterized protein YbaR (Trm112 family)
MNEKIQLEESELPPVCPHCRAALTQMAWHKVKGGPWSVHYIAILSCPFCKKALGALGS